MGNLIFPEYWYEEVSFKQLVEEQAAIKFVPDPTEAKERYEKAVQYVKSYSSGSGLTIWDLIYNGLKIAAGLEEDKI